MVDGGAFTQHKAKTIKKIMIVKQSKNRLQCNYTRVLLILSNGFSNVVPLQSGVRLYFLVKSFLNSNQMKQKKKIKVRGRMFTSCQGLALSPSIFELFCILIAYHIMT